MFDKNFIPLTKKLLLPFAKKIVLMTIPKENTISYLMGSIIALFVTLCFLAHTVYKMARPLFQSGTIKVDSNVADQLAEIDQSEEKDSPDATPTDTQEDKTDKPTDTQEDKQEDKTTDKQTESSEENKLIPS